jgi:hypothetical protein
VFLTVLHRLFVSGSDRAASGQTAAPEHVISPPTPFPRR